MEEARNAYAAANGGSEPVNSAQLFAFLDANPDIEQGAIQSARMRVADTVKLETFNGVAPGYSVAGTHYEAESDPVVGMAESLLGWQVTSQDAEFLDSLPAGSVVNTLPVHTHGFGANLDARDMPMQSSVSP